MKVLLNSLHMDFYLRKHKKELNKDYKNQKYQKITQNLDFKQKMLIV